MRARCPQFGQSTIAYGGAGRLSLMARPTSASFTGSVTRRSIVAALLHRSQAISAFIVLPSTIESETVASCDFLLDHTIFRPLERFIIAEVDISRTICAIAA